MSVQLTVYMHECCTIGILSPGDTNLDALMTTLITAVEEHNVQLEREIQEEVKHCVSVCVCVCVHTIA